MEKNNVLLLLLAALALALFVAMGGDGAEPERHARWMAKTKESGAVVLW